MEAYLGDARKHKRESKLRERVDRGRRVDSSRAFFSSSTAESAAAKTSESVFTVVINQTAGCDVPEMHALRQKADLNGGV
jgi:hypothetical protein